MTHTGNCPRCGAAIWSCPNLAAPEAVPQTVFTCECHKWLQLPQVVPFPIFQPVVQPVHPFPSLPNPAPWESPFWVNGQSVNTTASCLPQPTEDLLDRLEKVNAPQMIHKGGYIPHGKT